MIKTVNKRNSIKNSQSEYLLPKKYLYNKNYSLKAVKINKIQEHLNYYLSWLTEGEYGEYAAFRNHKRRFEWLAARVAAKKLIEENRILEYGQKGEILKDKQGAPYIKNKEEVFLSISHSNNMAIVATASHPVGIDLEYIEPRPQSLCQFFFCPEEQAYLSKLSDGDKSFAINQFWTYKEAVSKVLRLGGKMNFRQINSLCANYNDPITQLIIESQSFIISNYMVTIAYGMNQNKGKY